MIGLLASVDSAWMAWSVYRDGEFGVSYQMVMYMLSLFVTVVLFLVSALPRDYRRRRHRQRHS